MILPKSARTRKTELAYQMFKLTDEAKDCPFCKKQLVVKEYKYWVHMKNRFPYDEEFEKSHLLAPKRHLAKERNLTRAERREYYDIKDELSPKFEFITENLGALMSKPDHFHKHLLVKKLA